MDGASVMEGNMFAVPAFPATLDEFAAVVLEKNPDGLQPAEVASAIQPGAADGAVVWSAGKGAVQVLDRATWTAFFTRHLLHTANAADQHLRTSLGTPDNADAFAARVEPYLKDTPWVLALEASRAQRDQTRYRPPSCTAFVRWVQRRPETVPAFAWYFFSNQCRDTRGHEFSPRLEPW